VVSAFFGSHPIFSNVQVKKVSIVSQYQETPDFLGELIKAVDH
jgi:hypothetical protein